MECASALVTPPTRIMAIRDGECKPLFDTKLEGSVSPSASLLIEKHDVRPGTWQTLTIPGQVLTLALCPHTIEYEGSGGSRFVTRDQGSVSIEDRACKQTIRWDLSASTLSIQLADSILDEAADVLHSVVDLCPLEDASHDTRLSCLMYTIESERVQGYPCGSLFLDGLERALAAIVVRYVGITQRTPKQYKGGLPPYQIKRINEFVQNHIATNISIKDLAKEIGLSPSHFCSLFHRTSGMTPHQFVLECRIRHAKSLLTDRRHSLLDVALASGFRTHPHFSRIFNRLVGVPPRVYRCYL